MLVQGIQALHVALNKAETTRTGTGALASTLFHGLCTTDRELFRRLAEVSDPVELKELKTERLGSKISRDAALRNARRTTAK